MIVVWVIIVGTFVTFRFYGLHLPYHQDEMTHVRGPGSLSEFNYGTPHPPLMEIFFMLNANIFSHENLRGMIIIFWAMNLILVFIAVKIRFGIRPAFWASGLYAISFYAMLGSFTMDADGAILPFFFLLSTIFLFGFQGTEKRSKKLIFGFFLGLAVILGVFTKLSFTIVIGVLILEFLIANKSKLSLEMLEKLFAGLIISGLLLALALMNADKIYTSFNFYDNINHAKSYFSFFNRSFLQVFIETVKAIFYASPLLFLPILFLDRKRRHELRFLFLYLIVGIFFFYVAFDFSRMALDKYLAFIIAPLSIICGVALSDAFRRLWQTFNPKAYLPAVLFCLGIIALLFSLQFLNHEVAPLYPKEAWLGKAMSLNWTFLFPFTGGSGPAGFYVSILFIALAWILSVFSTILAWRHKRLGFIFLVLLVGIGLSYNSVFAEELIFGKINGSLPRLLRDSIEFISQHPEIPEVITYNNIGQDDLKKIGKFRRRLYAIPKNEVEHSKTLNDFRGHYLVIDIPKINSQSMYMKYFFSCTVVFEEWSQKISSRIYYCRNAIVPVPSEHY